MRRLVLVRHAATVPTAGRPPATWPLRQGAAADVAALGRRLAEAGTSVGSVVTSIEPKAVATGRWLAGAAGVRPTTAPGLQEHERGALPVLDERAWQAAVRRLFRYPDTLVFGRETATEALRRFARALEAVMAAHAEDDVTVVSHGTVMSLLVAAHNDVDAFELWSSLAMPEALVLRWPGLELLERLR